MQDDKSLTSTHYPTNDRQGIRPQFNSPRLVLVNKCHKITTKWYSGKETKPSQKDPPISQLSAQNLSSDSPQAFVFSLVCYVSLLPDAFTMFLSFLDNVLISQGRKHMHLGRAKPFGDTL